MNVHFSGCCYFLSSAINPFLYSLLSKRFRRGFHDLKYKILLHLRMVSPRTSTSRRLTYGEQQGPRTILSIRNKQSIRFKSRQAQTHNELNRHLDRPTSFSENNNNASCNKRKESLEIEMFRVANEINSYWKYSSTCLSSTIPVEMIEIKKEERGFNKQKNENLNPVQPSSSQTQTPKFNCKYTDLHKPASKNENTHLAILKDGTKKTTKKGIPRCQGMIDLRSVGNRSAMARLNRHKSQILYSNSKTLSKDQSHKKRTFSIKTLSS